MSLRPTRQWPKRPDTSRSGAEARVSASSWKPASAPLSNFRNFYSGVNMMADRVSASIVIGGELASDDFITLCRLIVEDDLAIEWDGEPFAPGHRTDGEPLRLFAHEVTGGQFETLESWCIAHAAPLRSLVWRLYRSLAPRDRKHRVCGKRG